MNSLLYGKHPCHTGALVGHPDYGRGRVTCHFGDVRIVEFKQLFEKTAEEMTEDELRENDFGQEVLGIAWTVPATKIVSVSQLKLFLKD